MGQKIQKLKSLTKGAETAKNGVLSMFSLIRVLFSVRVTCCSRRTEGVNTENGTRVGGTGDTLKGEMTHLTSSDDSSFKNNIFFFFFFFAFFSFFV